jgi:hypothetical protein
MSGSLKDT